MKKFIFTAFAFFMFQVILAQQVNPLQNDKEVIDLQESYNKILKLIFSSNRGNLQRLESVGNAIREIDVNLSELQVNAELVRILNLPLGYDMASDLRNFGEKLSLLKQKYQGDFNEKNVLDVITASKFSTIEPADIEGEGPCRDNASYVACSIVSASTATTASLACSFGIVLFPAYLVCQAAVAVGQTAAIYLCYRTYCL